jgi:hypothetical protein
VPRSQCYSYLITDANRIYFAAGKLGKTNLDQGITGNTRVGASASDPFDTPQEVVIRKRVDGLNGLPHCPIINDSWLNPKRPLTGRYAPVPNNVALPVAVNYTRIVASRI